MASNQTRAFAVVGAVLMVLSVFAPAAVASHDDGSGLEFEVTQDENYDATVTVTEDGSPVAGANVTVETYPPGRDYAGAGEYVTDGNGTVELPAPEDDVLVTVTVENNGSTASDRLVLKANDSLEVEVEQNDDYTATVTVTENDTAAAGANVSVNATSGNYTGEGDYVADANGTVELPAPEEEVEGVITASYNNSTATTEFELEANESDEEESDLVVEATQNDDFTTTVTVTRNDSAVAGANVTVETVPPDDSYVGTGEYVTDENGTVTLPVPESDVKVRVRAADNGSENATVIDLAAPEGLEVTVVQDLDYNVTVTVTDNGSAAAGANVTVETLEGNYTGGGLYTTDENGTVGLPAPEEEVEIEVTAEYDNDTETVTATLAAPGEEDDGNESNESENFGQLLTDFIEGLNETDGPRGLVIAEFVHENNPGNPAANGQPFAEESDLSIAVEQADGNATVTVTENGTPAANATVEVDAFGGMEFDGEGTYTTGENGTVTFGLPDLPTMTTISASYNNSSTSERVRLSGTQVGPPADAGPPGDDTESDDDSQGPPEDAGPPADAGPPGDDGGNETDGGEGPPDDAGPPGDDDGEGDDDGGEGPPDDAGPPGDDDEDESDEGNNGNGNGGGPPGDGNGNGNGNGGGPPGGGNGNGNGNGGGPP